MNTLYPHPVRLRSIPPLFLVVLVFILPLLFSPVAATDISVEAGAVHACADDCSCMPAAQAEQLGYIACSYNQTPCFHDSMKRPLYCYKSTSGTCSTDCDAAVSPPAVLNASVTFQPDSTLNTSGMPAAGGGSGMSTAAGEPDILASFFRFIRSLFGLS